MKKLFYSIWLLAVTICSVFTINAQVKVEKQFAIEKTQTFIKTIADKSYPEIKLEKLKIKTFESDTNFFKARFSYTRFLTFQKMRHIVFVNPKIFALNAPENAIRSIIAHELAHVLYYTEKNRLQLLGLASLTSVRFTTKFERRADLEAIKRGYGNGLIAYREWLYKQIPIDKIKAKRRDYFSPEEINLILEITKNKPEMFGVWRKNIPKNIDEIKKSID